jgi:Glycosyl transferases group 1
VPRQPRILAVVSAIDLGHRYGCTPAWWQLWKGLYEVGVDLIVTPYRGRAIESPWWRTEENPCYREGEAFDRARRAVARFRGDTHMRRDEESPEDAIGDRVVRETIWRWVTPRWKRHLERILDRETVDAVVVFTVPPSHLRGIPTALRERFGVPMVFYDADVPMSLPEFGGMDTGFNIYHGADIFEYDLVLSNSEGGIPRLLELGARRADHLFWGADPELFKPLDVEKEHDVVFYGYGDKFRRNWLEAMISRPSERMPEARFAVVGADFNVELGRAREVGWMPVSSLVHLVSASRINLNIGRRPHATVPTSSTSRIFELASAGATIVSNPYEGIERWFEPGHDLVVVDSTDEAVETYGELLADPARAEELGRNARERVLAEHTYAQRAKRLLELVGVRDPVSV